MGIEICDVTTKSCDKYYSDYIEDNEKSELSVVASFIKEQINNREPMPEKLPYKGHCYSCRIFGSTSLSSHLRISDFYPGIGEMIMKRIGKKPSKE